MYKIINRHTYEITSGENITLCDIVADSANDLPDAGDIALYKIAFGSFAYVIDEGVFYSLDSSGTWNASSSGGDIPSPSSSNPVMDGTAAPGTSTDYARADHVHPSDTTKANIGDIPSPSSSNPVMDGTAAPGTSTDYARADHVHPSDTSKVSIQDVINALYGTIATSIATGTDLNQLWIPGVYICSDATGVTNMPSNISGQVPFKLIIEKLSNMDYIRTIYSAVSPNHFYRGYGDYFMQNWTVWTDFAGT